MSKIARFSVGIDIHKTVVQICVLDGRGPVGRFGKRLAEGVRGSPGGPGKTSERTGARELPSEEGGGGTGCGPLDPERGVVLGKLLSPTRRREAVDHACRELSVSERRACGVLGQSRSTQRHRPVPSPGEHQLRSRIIELAREYGRYGYRRITAMLWREGWQVNHKKVERIWRWR